MGFEVEGLGAGRIVVFWIWALIDSSQGAGISGLTGVSYFVGFCVFGQALGLFLKPFVSSRSLFRGVFGLGGLRVCMVFKRQSVSVARAS